MISVLKLKLTNVYMIIIIIITLVFCSNVDNIHKILHQRFITYISNYLIIKFHRLDLSYTFMRRFMIFKLYALWIM